MRIMAELSLHDLQKIKKPVMFYISGEYLVYMKIRILLPTGDCSYMWLDPENPGFVTSCFQATNLQDTIYKMILYDQQNTGECKYFLIDELP